MAQWAEFSFNFSRQRLPYYHTDFSNATHGLILIVHDSKGHMNDFASVLRELSDSEPTFVSIAVNLFKQHSKKARRVVQPAFVPNAVDLFGQPVNWGEFVCEPSIPGFAEVLIAFCKELGLRHIVLAGHGMGCRIVLDAWRHAQQESVESLTIETMVFLDGGHYKLHPSLFEFEEKKAEEAFNNPKEEERYMYRSKEELEYIQKLRTSHLQYDTERMDQVLAAFGKANVPLLNLQSTDVNAENEKVPMKAGQRSKWMMHLDEKVPRVTHVVVEDGGDAPHQTRPALVAGRLRDIMDGLVKGGHN